MEIAGFILFSAVKYTGYAIFLKVIAPKQNAPNFWLVALIRLITGIIIGLLIYATFSTGRDILPAYISAILFGRLLIWYAIFRLFYKMLSPRKQILYTLGGTLLSYLLDIPSATGFLIVTGGIC